MEKKRELILIYNADSTIRGKVNYAIRKITSSNEESPACAACDITHGGLSLRHTPEWTKVRHAIEERGWEVVQWHRDEVEDSVKSWIQAQGIRYPVVLSRDGKSSNDDQINLVADSQELAKFTGDANRFFSMLQTKGLLDPSTGPSL